MDDGACTLEGCLNFRQVADLQTRDGRRVRRGVLYRSDTPQFVPEPHAHALVEDLGVRTVLDLRLPYEARVEGRGALASVPHRYVALPFFVDGAAQAGTAVPSMGAEDPVVRHYLGYLATSPEAVAGVIRALAEPDGVPALVHCTAGKDRTGVAVAVVLEALGVRREEVVAEYAAGADRMAAVFERLVELPSYGERVLALPAEAKLTEPATMARFLAAVDEQLGGVGSWLAGQGVDDEVLAALRENLTEPGI